MPSNIKPLTAAQIHALHMISLSNKGYLWVGDGIGLGKDKASRAVHATTAKALCKLGLVDHHSSSGWRSQGIGCWSCYKVTAKGKELIRIGRMLAKFLAESEDVK